MWSSGACREELGGRWAQTRLGGGLPHAAVGRDRRLWLGTSRFELLVHVHLHGIRCHQAGVHPESHLEVDAPATQLTKPKLKFFTQSLYIFFLGIIQIGAWEWNIIILHWGQGKRDWLHQWIQAWREKWEEKIYVELSRNLLPKCGPCTSSIFIWKLIRNA